MSDKWGRLAGGSPISLAIHHSPFITSINPMRFAKRTILDENSCR
jgi:hypothetical protein